MTDSQQTETESEKKLTEEPMQTDSLVVEEEKVAASGDADSKNIVTSETSRSESVALIPTEEPKKEVVSFF